MQSTLRRAFETVLEISWQAGVLVVLILIAQWLCRNHLSPKWRCAMWGLLLLRLAMPTMPQHQWSIWAVEPAPLPSVVSEQLSAARAIRSVQTNWPSARSNQPIVSIAEPISWGSIVALVWATGMVVALLRATGSCARFNRLVKANGLSPSGDSVQILANCCREMGIRRVPQLVVTQSVSTPAIFGAIRPALLLPPGIEHALSSSELRIVMMHELTHIMRRDVTAGIVLGLFRAIHWFNPLLWLASRRFKLDRELACDAALLSHPSAVSRQEYGKTILKVLENLGPGRSPVAAVAVVGSRSSVHARLKAIAQPAHGGAMVAILAMLLITAIGCATFTSPPRQSRLPSNFNSVTAVRTELVTHSFPVQDVQRIVQEFQRSRVAHNVVVNAPTSQPGMATLPATNTSILVRNESTLPPIVEPDKLVSALMESLEPNSWRGKGGNGSAELRGEQVSITQSARIQEKLQSMLKFGGRQIQVTTRFLTGSNKLDWERSRQDRWTPYAELQIWSDPLNDTEVTSLLDSQNKHQRTTTLTAPRLTVFNGERAFVKVATETAYVKDLTPIVSNEAVVFDPTVDTVESGVTLDCTAVIAQDGQTVTLNLHPKLQRLRALVPQPVSALTKDGKTVTQAFIQIPQVDTIEFDRTIRVPSGQTMLIKVGTIVGEVERTRLFGKSIEPDEQNFYLLVAATIVNPDNPQ